MPARTAPPSLALGNASQQFLFDGSNMGLMLSPAAEQLAKISMLFKSGGISSEQRSQMKDHLYMSLSQDSLLQYNQLQKKKGGIKIKSKKIRKKKNKI